MPSYFVTLEATGISAEVEAPTTRSARTTYLDYLTRNKIVPWKGRNSLRDSIVVDRIESGQMDVDIKLDYKLEDSSGVSDSVLEIGDVNGNGRIEGSGTIPSLSPPELDLPEPRQTSIPLGLSDPKRPMGDIASGGSSPIGPYTEGESKIGRLSKNISVRGRIHPISGMNLTGGSLTKDAVGVSTTKIARVSKARLGLGKL